MARVEEIWIYPVKGCRGVRLETAVLTHTGLELDRYWCVVDLDGVAVSRLEAISKRKLPILATISLSIRADGTEILMEAPGMEVLCVPVAHEAYAQEESIVVECAGKSTTQGDAGWWLGSEEGWLHAKGSEWLTRYLNREMGDGNLLSGKRRTNYALVRSKHGVSMESYPPIFPIIAKANTEKRADYVSRFKGNQRRFSDFAPLLIANRTSAAFVGEHGGTCTAYPIDSFRANIIVETEAAWAEETWALIEVAGVTFTKIKECPRCTVPCRDELTGHFIFPDEKLKLWRVLRKAFPRKASDPEWGSWAGPFFGVYFGNAGMTGKISVGDPIRVLQSSAWDSHLTEGGWRRGTHSLIVLSIVFVAVAVRLLLIFDTK